MYHANTLYLVFNIRNEVKAYVQPIKVQLIKVSLTNGTMLKKH